MEHTKERTARLMGMSHAALVMHAQDLTYQRDELLAMLQYAASCLGTDGNDPIDLLIASIKEETK